MGVYVLVAWIFGHDSLCVTNEEKKIGSPKLVSHHNIFSTPLIPCCPLYYEFVFELVEIRFYPHVT